MKFRADEIASVIQKEIETYKTEVDIREVEKRDPPVGPLECVLEQVPIVGGVQHHVPNYPPPRN